jgi:hypothetical protein
MTGAIATIDGAWAAIKYTNAIFDENQKWWISDAQVAELAYTASTSKLNAKRVSPRLIVRRVKDITPTTRASCSPPAGITPCSPTARPRCWPPRACTAHTQSSSKSSPTEMISPGRSACVQFWHSRLWSSSVSVQPLTALAPHAASRRPSDSLDGRRR